MGGWVGRGVGGEGIVGGGWGDGGVGRGGGVCGWEVGVGGAWR